jgi:pyruvate dehydrogenase E1 component alpha subunit
MHMADVEKNFWGGHAIVGAHICRLRPAWRWAINTKEDGITICMFGDGATNIGYFHEARQSLAKVWNLPVLWVCENNQYGMGTSVERASAVSEIAQKAEGYGMRNVRVEGMDVLQVREAALEALETIREGNGPMLMEIITYRFRGHSMGDPERYRESGEVKKWQENDPIGIYRKRLVEEKLATEDELDAIDQQVEAETDAAVQFAESSPEPELEELFTDIYVEA